MNSHHLLFNMTAAAVQLTAGSLLSVSNCHVKVFSFLIFSEYAR